MEKEGKMKLDLNDIVKDHKIFLDSSALLSDEYRAFWDDLSPVLARERKTVLIPIKAFVEVKKSEDPTAQDTIRNLERLYNLGLIEFIGSQDDIENDDLYPTIFGTLSQKHSILFITQDRELAARIHAVTAKSLNPLTIARFSHGALMSFETLDEKNQPAEVRSLVLGPFGSLKKKALNLFKRTTIPKEESFPLAKTITALPEEVIPVSSLPAEGDRVYTRTGGTLLTRELAAGGEGKIYETDTGLIAKIYKKERITLRRREKISLMLSKKIEYPGICYPVEILYNENHEFVGYLMPKAKGKELQKSVFVKKLFKRSFPNWTKKDTVQLALTILEKIIYLNSHGIIMGDINPMNILVVSPTEVYFVDTDSYQVEDFPCPVGTVNFTAPEIQGVSFSEFLRSPAHERFAIATLMFMLMLPGKPPYSQRGGEGPQQNILNMDFSYPYHDFYNGKTPKGPWAAMWSHLPDAVQEAFFCSFRINECFSSPEKRLSGEDWYTLFSEYLGLLGDARWEEIDREALELFPRGFRANDPSRPRVSKKSKHKKKRLPTCKDCGKAFEKEKLKAGLCPDCLKKEEKRRLDDLKRQAIFNTPNIKVTKTPTPKTNVYNPKRQTTTNTNANVKTLICRKCHKHFPDYEMKAGLCPSCRASSPASATMNGFQKRQEEKELMCRSCHGLFKAKDMQGGLCPDCRAKMGIKERKRPVVTVGGDNINGIQGARNVRVQKPQTNDKMLFCRKCHKTFPDYEMRAGLCPDCRGEAHVGPRVQNQADTKELICRGCHKTYPDYQMKGGLCESCRNVQKTSAVKQGSVIRRDPYNPTHDRMFRCDSCGLSFPVSELSGGLCADCRRKRRLGSRNSVSEGNPTKKSTDKNTAAPEKTLEEIPDHGFNRSRGNSRRYFNQTDSKPKSWKERFKKENSSTGESTTSFKKPVADDDILNTQINRKDTTRRKRAREALDGIFKDTPVEQLSDFVSWLTDKNE